jgi:NAD(P)-dependent dehydrogenase (short-subunit alcohol dehydrogenase family)
MRILVPKNRAQFKKISKWTVVVTGGGSGIGTMMASAYVQNGAKVYIASRKEEQLKEVGHVSCLGITTYITNLTGFFTPNKKVSEKLNKIGPGSCEYVVANLGVSQIPPYHGLFSRLGANVCLVQGWVRQPRRGRQGQGRKDPYPRQQLWHVVGRAI